MRQKTRRQKTEDKRRWKRGRNVFLMVCDAPSAAACIAALENWAWQDLYGYLVAEDPQTGFASEVYGRMFVDGARRFAKSLNPLPTLNPQPSTSSI